MLAQFNSTWVLSRQEIHKLWLSCICLLNPQPLRVTSSGVGWLGGGIQSVRRCVRCLFSLPTRRVCGIGFWYIGHRVCFGPCVCVCVYVYVSEIDRLISLSAWHFTFSRLFFLGALANMWKATVSFVMPVHPHGITRLPLDGFSWNLVLESFFRKFVEKIQVSLKSDQNNCYFIWKTICGFFIVSRLFLIGTRTDSEKSCNDIKISKHILYSITFFSPENCALYEILWKHYIPGQATKDNKIGPMRTACWIRKATNTHWECVTHCFSTATMVARTQFIVTKRVHCPSCSTCPCSDFVAVSKKPFCLLNIFSQSRVN